jgi:hypothetical protein
MISSTVQACRAWKIAHLAPILGGSCSFCLSLRCGRADELEVAGRSVGDDGMSRKGIIVEAVRDSIEIFRVCFAICVSANYLAMFSLFAAIRGCRR